MKGLILAALAALTVFAVDEHEGHPRPPKIDDPRFAFLTSLAGTWTSESVEGEGGTTEYRVAAGGTIVEEHIFKDTPMEMLTVYHMDGKRLLATHYCMLGNAPTLVAAPRSSDGVLSFTCDGAVANAASHDALHIHGLRMSLDERGRLNVEVDEYADGAVGAEPMRFVATRQ